MSNGCNNRSEPLNLILNSCPRGTVQRPACPIKERFRDRAEERGFSAKSARSSGATIEAAPAQNSEKANPDNPHYRPGRATKSNVTGYFDPAVKKQLRMMMAENETTIQGLLAEALNDLFAKYGKPEIAKAEAEE